VLLATNRRAERIRARSLLEELVRRGDANTEDMFILARVHEIQSNPDRAEELMRKVLSEPSGAPVTADPLVFETERLLRQNQTARAKETLDRLIELEPDSARTTSLRCKYLKATGDLNQARAIVKRFESSHEGNFADFASLYELVEDPEQADQNYRRLVDVKDDASSIIKYLDFLVRSQKPAEAIKLVRERGHRAPREVIVSHLLKTYQRTGATREQQREIDSFVEQAAREEPANRQVQVGLATLRAFQGRAEEAEAICRELLSRDPANGVLQALLAWLLGVREESHSEAIGLINRAIETLGPDPDLLDTRAVIHLASGRVDEAIAELQNVTSQRPSSVYWFHLSRAQWRARDLEGAKQSFRRASEAGLASETIHPMERDAYRELASALGFQS
jgi:tetratricopeptide (TPR) repeat protein